jgi:hypothetical protein
MVQSTQDPKKGSSAAFQPTLRFEAPLQPYVIKQGDHLALLAYKFGFDADTVWNDPKNAQLRQLAICRRIPISSIRRTCSTSRTRNRR